MSTDNLPIPNTGSDLTQLSWSELMALMDGGNAVHIQEIDEKLRVDKEQLVGVPFVITNWRYNPDGDMGDFMFVEITTMDDRHLFFTDGSTGIKEQLMGYQEKLGGAIRPIYVPKGLRVSNYTYHDEAKDIDIPAQTFYINNES